MHGVRPAVLTSSALGVSALVLTLDELSRTPPHHFSWPNALGVGALILLALVISLAWLILDSRSRSRARKWAKSALAMAAALPCAWLTTERITFGKLSGLPDGPMPDGFVERMNADVVQMQVCSLFVTMGVLACVGMAHWHRAPA